MSKDIVSVAQSYIGVSVGSYEHRQFVDVYNTFRPLPRSYKVRYDDPWCDVFVSFCIYKAGLRDTLGVECGCPSHVAFLKKNKLWTTDKPSSGFLVFFSSNGNVPDHVGIVETVSGNSITTIEGNSNGQVRRNYYHLDDKYILGYGVNEEFSHSSVAKRIGTVNVEALNVRTWAGTEYDRLKHIPVIYRGQTVEIVNELNDRKGNLWYYIMIPYKADQYIFGFVFAEYITTN